MTELDSIVDSIFQTCESLSSLKFRHSSVFTDAVLKRSQITPVIRDAEPEERRLFTIGTKDGARYVQSVGPRAGDDMRASGVPGLGDDGDADIEGICTELERLIKIYPAATEISDRVAYLRERAAVVLGEIGEVEARVEHQREQLNTLHSATNDAYGAGRDDEAPAESVAHEQARIAALERALAQEQEKIRDLDEQLMRY
ncbi:uncharacterized protein V1510DRAFT_2142 [Dipodascopsis tothii]|uniref:uncharacterized protein n=1 Tax=Dipodascopsis tothii TaxID=44089 RepID=UPI0034CE55EC